MFSRLPWASMDFPDCLRPSLFMSGPLGLSDTPDLSFMCSWRDALTLPAPQPPKVRRWQERPLLRPWSPELPGLAGAHKGIKGPMELG